MNILNRALTLLLKYHNHSHTSKLLLPDDYYYYFWSLIQRKHCTPEVQHVSNAVLTQVFNSFPANILILKRLCLKENIFYSLGLINFMSGNTLKIHVKASFEISLTLFHLEI